MMTPTGNVENTCRAVHLLVDILSAGHRLWWYGCDDADRQRGENMRGPVSRRYFVSLLASRCVAARGARQFDILQIWFWLAGIEWNLIK